MMPSLNVPIFVQTMFCKKIESIILIGQFPFYDPIIFENYDTD